MIEKNNIYIVTNKDYREKIKEELRDIEDGNIITEPMNKETATCIGLSAVRLLKQDKDAVLVVLPSDHHIENEDDYIETLTQAVEIANRRKSIVTLGINPIRPETGYGYIEMGERVSKNSTKSTYKVTRFIEKPNIEVAKDFIYKGSYLWNSGMFVFRADVMIREIEKYLPKLHKSLMNIYNGIGSENEMDVIEKEYESIDGISIDFGVMQRTRKCVVIKCDFAWDDIGSFSSLSKFLKKDGSNSISELAFLDECENCSVFSKEKLVIGLGVKDLIIVEADDVVLIMDKNRDQEIKYLLNQLEADKKYKKYL